jgi:MarR family transcriptional regulator, organic hydroperoxide resistance regulator
MARSKKKGKAVRGAAAVAGDGWLDEFIPYQLYRVTNKLNAKLLSRLRGRRINPSKWRVLSVLKAYGWMSIGRIVETTLLEQPTVSRVVAQLEREGRVARRTSDVDSRVMEISLTAAGVEAFNHIMPAALNHQELAFRNISRKEIEALVGTLSKIEKNIEFYD